MSNSRKQIVVVGGSFGGINAAYELRRRFGQRAEIMVVSKDRDFTFHPSLPWVILGWRDPRAVQVPIQTPLERKGIRFVHGEVERLDPNKCEIATSSESFHYDAALIACGADLDYAAIPGLGPHSGHTHSTFTVEEAARARDALARVMAQEEGRIVIGATPGASCIGPAYELVMMIDTALKRLKKRHRFSLTFLTPEPFIGHFGVDGIGASPRMVQDEFAERSIDTVINAQIVEAQPDRIVLHDGSEYPYDFSLVIPAFRGAAFVRSVDGLANPKGFVTVNPQMASEKFPNIYAAGVAIAIPPPRPTPVPVAVPKTGHMTELMARAAARNIAAEFQGGSKVDGLTIPSSCIADAGDTAFYLAADPFLPPRNRVITKKGKWARYLKLMFEKYYLAQIRYDLPPLDFGW
ncbi:MAG: NAD(P)/FAD-dependent oxidoreductase [Acidobacteriota bacterium]